MAEIATRRFHKKLYRFAAIQDALEAYGPFCTLAVDRGGEAWTVTISEPGDELSADLLANELGNFVLAGTIQARR